MTEESAPSRSARPLFLLAFAAGLGLAAYLYLVKFDDLSETELVNYSGIWFLLLVFGGAGLVLEGAKRLIVAGEAEDLAEGVSVYTRTRAPLGKLLFVPFLLYNAARDKTATLPVAVYVAAVWALLFYAFMVGVFPNL